MSRFVWRELMVRDIGAAKELYAGLFGWSFEEVSTGKADYSIIRHRDRSIGGMVDLGVERHLEPHWKSYVSAEDVDGLVHIAKSEGGNVFVGPADIPRV